MGKNRNKKKVKQNTVSKPSQFANINLPENMSAEEMQHIIAKAIVEADEEKEKNRRELQEKERAEWQKRIGFRDFSHIKNKLWKNIRIAFNRVHMFLNVLVISKKKISGDRAPVAFLQAILSVFFGGLQALAFVFLIIFIISFIIAIFNPSFLNIASLGIYEKIGLALWALNSFLFSRIFRIISIEIDKNEDHNYLFNLFASVTSLVSIIIAVIAIVKVA